MKSKGIILIHISDNGDLPTIEDVEGYSDSWNHKKILKSSCLEMGKDGILSGAYKEINVAIAQVMKALCKYGKRNR